MNDHSVGLIRTQNILSEITKAAGNLSTDNLTERLKTLNKDGVLSFEQFSDTFYTCGNKLQTAFMTAAFERMAENGSAPVTKEDFDLVQQAGHDYAVGAPS